MNISKIIIVDSDNGKKITELTSIAQIKELFGINNQIYNSNLFDLDNITYDIVEQSFCILDNLDFEIFLHVNQQLLSD
jgi:alkyl sulfatase BDS1-like metallo-beta-lactamase superfamily hydrolase